MNLALLGINFKTAPVEVREKVSFSAAEVPAALQRLTAACPDAELVLLSTCNRTELYVAGVDLAAQRPSIVRALCKADSGAAAAGLEAHFYAKTDLEAAKHLCAVASGLDSMVVGETEILGQLKQSYALSGDARVSGRRLGPFFHMAFRCARRVHAETDLARGKVSVSSVAVEFAEKVFEDLSAKTIMIVGAGETAELALKSLMDRGARDILVLNRSLERGQALAERHGGRAIQFDLLDDYLPRADIVISSTSAPHYVIHAGAVRRASDVRRGRSMLLIDIAVPRDIDPAAGQVKDVYLYAIDDLQRIAAANLAKRQTAVDAAWAIVRQGTTELAAQFDDAGLRELLRRLDAHARQTCNTVLERALAREKLATLPEPAREDIRILAQQVVNKLLAQPREAVKRAAHNGGWHEYAQVVNDLFGLDRKDADVAPEPRPGPRDNAAEGNDRQQT